VAILAAYDFSVFGRVIDVGGGQGALLRGILEWRPNTTRVLCDIPSVVAEGIGDQTDRGGESGFSRTLLCPCPRIPLRCKIVALTVKPQRSLVRRPKEH
jgi:hypothetical protein